MLRHDFQPGKLVAGAALTAAGVLYAGDAADHWQIPWYVMIPLVLGGLCLAGVTGTVGHTIRRRRGSRGTRTP
ncbi:hypothetical protein [Streptomyces sp. NPDC058045]|uniref:hypothetical protein n=1 Tax=Streptomyces sp. NPDC058045 TaxID=3346311 RepID=UPI0036E9BD13